ncbi:MAG: hypothetical protein KY455_13885 [Euryarchaeota archaeon]|nr:hypothetical protein [Euryarchaeota archaeon]
MRSGVMRISVASITAMMLTGLAPPIGAEEVVTAVYDVPSGLQTYTCGRPYCAFNVGLCTSEWEEWEGGLLNGPEDDALAGPLTAGFTTACGTAREARDRDDRAAVQVGVEKIASECGDCYLDFLITVDDLLGGDTYFSFCIITANSPDNLEDDYCGDQNPRGPPIIDETEDPKVEGCGSGSVTSPVEAGGGDTHTNVAFVWATYVDETTSQVCLGMTGDLIVAMT